MTLLDRVLFLAYLRSYAIVLTTILSLYVVIDLFTNLEDFAGRGGLGTMLAHIGTYYGYRLSQIFDRLSEPICLLAATFTVAWVQRNNELLPQLSAGISTRRVIRPVLLGSMLMLALGPLNQEFVIPTIAEDLQTSRNDPDQDRPTDVKAAYDTTGVHVEGLKGFRKEQRVKGFYVTFPESSPSGMLHVAAEDAIYIPPGKGEHTGGWQLYNATPETLDDNAHPQSLIPLGPRRYFLITREVDFETLARGPSWFQLASTPTLRALLDRPDPRRLAPVAVLYHSRITRSLAGALLVLLGLSVILRDQNRHVFFSAGLCLAMCALFYVLLFTCKYLGDSDLISPPLAAWIPVLLFGPFAISQFDAIHT